MMRLHRLIGAAGLAVALAGCNGDEFTDTPVVPTAAVRFINAVPDTGAVDFRFVDIVENSSFFAQPFRSTASTAVAGTFNTLVFYQPAKTGQRHIKVFFASSTQSVASVVIVDTTVTLTEGKYYTFVLYGHMRAGSVPGKKLMVMEDTPSDPGAQVGLRVVNLGPALGAVDAYVAACSITPSSTGGPEGRGTCPAGTRPASASLTNVAEAGSSPQVSFAAATPFTASATPGTTYRFWFTAAGGATDLLSAPASAPQGTVGTINQNPVPGVSVAGSVLTAFVFNKTVVGSTAQNFTTPGVIFSWDKRPPNTRPN
jgi:hypothetical protein